MANPFAICTITQDGANLIAQATAANPIVFVDAMTSESAAADVADLAGKALSFYNGPTGSIDAVSAVGSNARIIVRFPNALDDNDINIKSVCVTARLANQTGGIVPFAAMSDANSTIYIPGSSKPSQIIRFPMNIKITDLGSVQTVSASAAAPGDLDRFVSSHAAGDPTSGEAQTILGSKSFSSNIHVGRTEIFPGGMRLSSASEIEGSVLGSRSRLSLTVGDDVSNRSRISLQHDSVSSFNGIEFYINSSDPVACLKYNSEDDRYDWYADGFQAYPPGGGGNFLSRSGQELVTGSYLSDGTIYDGVYTPVVGGIFIILVTADGWSTTDELPPGSIIDANQGGMRIRIGCRYQGGWSESSTLLSSDITMRLMHGVIMSSAASLMPVLVQRVG